MHERNLEVIKSALICCECGVCELYACPMGLSPKTVNQFVKKELIAQGVRFEKDSIRTYEPLDMMPYRKIHTQRMMARTGLMQYSEIHLGEVIHYSPKHVRILLKQHIGAPAVPVVKTGEIVECGNLIAEIKEGTLGANIHASIKGRVTVEADAVVIDALDQMEVLDG
jgi:Na+-translocating ferredoxin:NAD+ oxidoreductase RnfC subunit